MKKRLKHVFKYKLGLYRGSVKVENRWFISRPPCGFPVYFVRCTSKDIGRAVSESTLDFIIGDAKPTILFPEVINKCPYEEIMEDMERKS